MKIRKKLSEALIPMYGVLSSIPLVAVVTSKVKISPSSTVSVVTIEGTLI